MAVVTRSGGDNIGFALAQSLSPHFFLINITSDSPTTPLSTHRVHTLARGCALSLR